MTVFVPPSVRAANGVETPPSILVRVLDIDTSSPLRSHRQLRALVKAVYDAETTDESDWIEWKSFVDLNTHEGTGTIARHVLGLANRNPATAAGFVGGCGYVLIGIEPGTQHGIPQLDPADLEPRLEQFMSSDDAPVWQANWLGDVLVVIVDPPFDGHPIHLLHKDFDGYQSGEVFVRRKDHRRVGVGARRSGAVAIDSSQSETQAYWPLVPRWQHPSRLTGTANPRYDRRSGSDRSGPRDLGVGVRPRRLADRQAHQ